MAAAPVTLLPAGWYHHGIRMRLCRTHLAVQPALAGLKHLNRLEQVLARREWQDQTLGEGLMLDLDDRVISAMAANVFAVFDGKLYTPTVDRCRPAGRPWPIPSCVRRIQAEWQAAGLPGRGDA